MKKNDSILAQIKTTFCRENVLAACVGFGLSCLIPVVAFVLGHYEIKHDVSLWFQVVAYLVAAGMVFSSITVYKWCCILFRTREETPSSFGVCNIKAIATAIILEGTMIFSETFWLTCLTLGILVFVNGVSTACNLVLDWHERKLALEALKPVKTETPRAVSRVSPKRKLARA